MFSSTRSCASDVTSPSGRVGTAVVRGGLGEFAYDFRQPVARLGRAQACARPYRRRGSARCGAADDAMVTPLPAPLEDRLTSRRAEPRLLTNRIRLGKGATGSALSARALGDAERPGHMVPGRRATSAPDSSRSRHRLMLGRRLEDLQPGRDPAPAPVPLQHDGERARSHRLQLGFARPSSGTTGSPGGRSAMDGRHLLRECAGDCRRWRLGGRTAIDAPPHTRTGRRYGGLGGRRVLREPVGPAGSCPVRARCNLRSALLRPG